MLQEIARTKGKSRQRVVKHRGRYSQWCAMRRRCYDPAFIGYPHYGAAGITVCDEWRTCYETFQTWALAHGWKHGLTIDRIDCKGNYEPANCRWLTRAEQSCNRLSWNIPVTIDGVTDLAGHWADKYGIRRSLVYNRIRNRGWDPVKAITTPAKKSKVTYVTVGGERHTIFAWARLLKVERAWIYQQVRMGRRPSDIIKRIINKKKEAK